MDKVIASIWGVTKEIAEFFGLMLMCLWYLAIFAAVLGPVLS